MCKSCGYLKVIVCLFEEGLKKGGWILSELWCSILGGKRELSIGVTTSPSFQMIKPDLGASMDPSTAHPQPHTFHQHILQSRLLYDLLNPIPLFLSHCWCFLWFVVTSHRDRDEWMQNQSPYLQLSPHLDRVSSFPSSLEKYFFKFTLKLCYLGFLLLSCASSSHILEINPFITYKLCNIFSNFVGCLFSLLMLSFAIQKLFSFK